LLAGLLAYPVVPQYPGFTVIPLFLALLLWIAAGSAETGSLSARLSQPAGRRRLRRGAGLAFGLILALAAGRAVFLPIWNPGPSQGLTLDEKTQSLLDRLTAPTEIEAFFSAQGEMRFGPLVDLFERASSKITVKKSQGPGRAETAGRNLTLALPDRLIITSGPYTETVYPISRAALTAAFRRIVTPVRLVWNLVGDGQKSVLDTSSAGLSQWALDLGAQKVLIADYFWAPDSPLPPGSGAVILAGPKRDLGELRNSALVNYLAQGGRLMVLQDPLTPGTDPAAFEVLGLNLGTGVLADPISSWAGTNDLFAVSQDFPAHPLTVGLTQPVVWPIAGMVHSPRPLTPADPSDPLAGHSWAVALSSADAYLETDREALAQRQPLFSPGQDPGGPLVLAAAASLASGGRLILAADSDLAANLFISQPGNRSFMDSCLYWLLGAEDDLPQNQGGSYFTITQDRARTLFWVPAVIWPLAAGIFWLLYYRRRHRLSS
jgi:hypothetical protein